jgi:hypothetical protein
MLPAKTKCQFFLAFTPSVFGPEEGSLTIQDNASNAPQVIPLSGTGK